MSSVFLGECVNNVSFGLGVTLDFSIVGNLERRPQSVKNLPSFPLPLSFPCSSMASVGSGCKGNGRGFCFAPPLTRWETLRAIEANPPGLEGDGEVGSEVELATGGRGKNIVLCALTSVINVVLRRGTWSKGLQFCPYGLRFDRQSVLHY